MSESERLVTQHGGTLVAVNTKHKVFALPNGKRVTLSRGRHTPRWAHKSLRTLLRK